MPNMNQLSLTSLPVVVVVVVMRSDLTMDQAISQPQSLHIMH